MNFIFYDFETTGRNSTWDQIIQVGAILTNENFEEIDTFEKECILKPGTVPEPGALMVTYKIPGKWAPEKHLSHYSFVKLMWEKFSDWKNNYDPIAFIGYNSINFDEEFLRRALYKNLFDPLLTTKYNFGVPGKRGDIINLARAVNIFYPGTLKTTFNEKGKEVYKLDELAPANAVMGEDFMFHDALEDVKATIEIARIIKNGAPILWDSALKTMHKKDVLKFINDEEFLLSSEFYFGTLRTYVVASICEGPKGGMKVFDLRNDPSQFIGLEYQELKKIISEAKPKIIRSIVINKSPILMPPEPEFVCSIVGYENIGIEELSRRAKILKENIQLSSQLKRLISEDVKDEVQDQSDKEPEECIWNFGFAGAQEKALMTKFHSSDWKGKLEIADHFQNLQTNDYNTLQRYKIYSEFARLIVYEEKPEILSEELKAKIRKKLADRIFYPDTDTVRSPWNNSNRAHMQIEKMGNEIEEEGKIYWKNEVPMCGLSKLPTKECNLHKESTKCDCFEYDFLCKTKDLIDEIENEYKDLKF